ncbi:CsbD family protein [Aquabacter spiritensis]|uniref:Uncharacterized protein YjbJ (UPF0337 family) n=1 Tax=Aquabacter spiritensis TaxID=933073 RepID=A0A4R3LR77_9HYPH|nr:uncharacterized protein YjbJ (UPF0337 family) [Aquabacter spiritensis]
MDEDRIKGAANEWGGKAKEAAGAISGNDSLRGEGYADQIQGRAENAVGQVKDYVNDRPMNAVLAAGVIGFVVGMWVGRH